MSGKLIFAYINVKKEFSIHVVNYIRQDEKYIQGIYITNGDSGQLRTYRKDQIIAKFDNELDANLYDLADNLEHALDVLATTIPSSKSTSASLNTFDIHFTGFKQADKQRLIKLAEEKELTVRKSVTLNLPLLCVGYNASIKKIEKAQEMGISLMNESDFLNFLETGEILLGGVIWKY